MTTTEIIARHRAMSEVYHASGADALSIKMYEASYEVLAKAAGGCDTLNAVLTAYAKGETLPEEWPVVPVAPVATPGVLVENVPETVPVLESAAGA
jgi:hypothetical protein